MVNDETKKYRELMAYGLLASAGLAVIAALSLLFKSGDDLGGNIGFAEKAALYGSLFESSLIILALVGAVVLVTRLGELSANARIVVLVAMGIGAVDLLFAVITFFAQFGAGSGFNNFGGALGAGKTVGAIAGLAELTFLGVALFYIFTAFRSLPAPVAAPAPQWGFGQYAGQNQQGAPGQQPWQQPDPGQAQQGWPQQGWTQPGASAGWAAAGTGQQPVWGQPQAPAPNAPVAPSPGWPQPDPTGWGQQQGYPSPAPPTTPTPPEAPAPFWGAAEAHVGGAPEPEETLRPDEAATSDDVPQPEGGSQSEEETAPTDDTPSSDQAPSDDRPAPTQGWWQHPQQ